MIHFLRKHIDQIVVVFLFLGPFFDLATGLIEHHNIVSIPVVYIFKILFLCFLVLYVLFISKSTARTNAILYVLGVICVGFLFLLNLIMSGKTAEIVNDAQQYIKAFYYPVVLVCFYCIFEKRKLNIDSRKLSIILGIYLILLWIPTVTGTGFNGYAQGKTGNVGWFYSMNEIGAILSILLPFMFLQIHRVKSVYFKIFTIILVASIYFGLGSKAPIMSLALVCLCYYILYLIKLYRWKNFKVFYIWFFSGLVALSIVAVTVPRTSFYKNIETHMKFLGIEKTSDLVSIEAIDRFVMSDRLTFMKQEGEAFMQSSIPTKMFGMGSHVKTEEKMLIRKTVEIDYFDVIFNFGIVGFILYFFPIWLLWQKAVSYHKGNKHKNIDLAIYFCALLLGYGLAFLTGHVLLAPSVSIYLATIHILLIQKGREQCYENRICDN